MPHATITMREISARSTSPIASRSGSTTTPSTMRPRSVFATASGPSLISFAMKLDQPPFSLADASQAISNSCVSTGAPWKSVTVTESGRMATIWSWPMATARRVNSTNAATSDPRKFSPSPSPMTSGELRRAPTTRPGWSRCTARSVKAPSSRLTVLRNACSRSCVMPYSRPRRRAATSVSVSLSNV